MWQLCSLLPGEVFNRIQPRGKENLTFLSAIEAVGLAMSYCSTMLRSTVTGSSSARPSHASPNGRRAATGARLRASGIAPQGGSAGTSADEIVHIIEGSVTVQGDGIAKRTLGVGDAALFRAGSWSEWEVEEYVRKHAIFEFSATSHGVVRGTSGPPDRACVQAEGEVNGQMAEFTMDAAAISM